MIPPRSILAAIDFSDASRVALEYAARLANHCGASLHVLHAGDPLLHAAASVRGVDLTRETREELETFVRSATPGASRGSAYPVVVGAPVTVICDIANRERVDLVVMGMQGMSGPEQMLFGSTAENVLVRSDVSVLVVPATWRAPDSGRTDLSGAGPIVAALECTTPALAATGAACRLATALGTSVHAVHVVPRLGVPARWQSHADAAVHQRLDDARAELEILLPGLRCEAPIDLHVESGAIAERLAARAGEYGPHALLVLGRHSPGSRRGAPGDVARRVVAQTGVPVLVYLPEQ